jgi:hypothetical protein
MSANDPKQTSTFEIMLQTRWARTNWRAVSCGLPWMANVTRHNCATMRSMASYPQPLGARRTDVEVALNETRHSCVWYSTFHRRKKPCLNHTLALSETVRSEVCTLFPLSVR